MSESLKNAFAVILFLFLCLFFYTKFLGPIPFSVNSINTQVIDQFQTTGTGEVTGVPDKASVYLGVTTNSTTADDARADANQIINNVTSELKKLGIKESEIKTTNFSVHPNNPAEPAILGSEEAKSSSMIYPPTRPTGTGYTASANLEVKTDSVDIANKAIDTASQAGANVIGGVNFTFDDEKMRKLEQEARKKAVAEAKEKAKDLAEASGIKLGRIINIQESGGGGYPYPVALKAPIAEDRSTDLNPGENTVSISVTLTFETL